MVRVPESVKGTISSHFGRLNSYAEKTTSGNFDNKL